MTTFERELIAHCEVLMTVFQAAGVPCLSAPGLPTAPDTWIALRPALRVPRKDHAWIERRICEDADRYHPACVSSTPDGWQVLMVQLHPFTMFIQHGRHPVCTQ